jgi:hypothetical protein
MLDILLQILLVDGAAGKQGCQPSKPPAFWQGKAG